MKRRIALLLILSLWLCAFPAYAAGYQNPRLQASNAEGTWRQDEHGWWYEYTDGGYPKGVWELIGDSWYRFDENGYILTGWQEQDGHRYYLSDQGAMLTGLQTIGQANYFFETSSEPLGAMVTGWRKFPGDPMGWAYFRSDTGICELSGQNRKGCRHGKATYGDLSLSAGSPILYHYWGSACSGQVLAGIGAWNQAAGFLSLQDSASSPAINLYDAKLEPAYAAVTIYTAGRQFYPNAHSLSKNWSAADIFLNLRNKDAVSGGTVAHEIGHGLGLDHRDADPSSLMYRYRHGTGISVPQQIDIETLEHLYGTR